MRFLLGGRDFDCQTLQTSLFPNLKASNRRVKVKYQHAPITEEAVTEYHVEDRPIIPCTH